MACGCCGTPNTTSKGCSCKKGKSHVCRHLVAAPPPLLQAADVPLAVAPVAAPVVIQHAIPGPIEAALPDPEQEDHQVLPFTSAAINTDWTNRKPVVRTLEKVTSKLKQLVTGRLNKPSLISLTEWSTKNTAETFQAESNYQGVAMEVTYDWSQSLWDAAWRPVIADGADGETEVSAVGKFIRTLLEHVESGRRIALFTVHLPHKKGRALAQTTLGQAIRTLEDNRQNVDVDGYVVAGDFNCAPDQLQELSEQLQGLSLTPQFTQNVHYSTCESGRFLDNVLFSESIRGAEASIFSTLNLFTHYPILAAGTLEL